MHGACCCPSPQPSPHEAQKWGEGDVVRPLSQFRRLGKQAAVLGYGVAVGLAGDEVSNEAGAALVVEALCRFLPASGMAASCAK